MGCESIRTSDERAVTHMIITHVMTTHPLDISGLGLGDSGANELGPIVAANATIEQLRMEANGITAEVCPS